MKVPDRPSAAPGEGSEDGSGDALTSLSDVFQNLPQRFRSGKTSRTLVYYFLIDEEQWTVTVGPESCDVKEGKRVEDPDCSLTTSKAILVGTFRGDYKPSLSDFLTGKIKSNNPQLLLTFREIFGDS